MIAMPPVLSTSRPGLAALLLCLFLGGCAGRALTPAQRAALSPLPPPPPDLVLTLPDGAYPAREWLPPPGVALRAVVLALHGFNDSRDAWALPGPAFAAAGVAVVAPDQAGFGAAPDRGRWPGTARLVDDAAGFVGLLARAWPGTPLYVMGESMGGAETLLLAARRPALPVAGYIALAPAVWGRAQMSPLLTSSLWLAASVDPGWKLTGRELPLHIVASDNRAALVALYRDTLTLHATRVDALRGLVGLMSAAQAAAPRVRGRVLVTYGGHDELVPAEATAALWRDLPPGVRRAWYRQGYHLVLRDRDRALVRGDIIAWMASPGRPLPSGADLAAAAWYASDGWREEPAPLLPAAALDALAIPARP